jgi:hypothetical protein
MLAALARGVQRAEIAPGLDHELLLDMLMGPYYFRALFGHARISANMNDKLVDGVLRAAAPSAARRPALTRESAHKPRRYRRRLPGLK